MRNLKNIGKILAIFFFLFSLSAFFSPPAQAVNCSLYTWHTSTKSCETGAAQIYSLSMCEQQCIHFNCRWHTDGSCTPPAPTDTPTPTPPPPSCTNWTSVNVNGCTQSLWNKNPKDPLCLFTGKGATLHLNSARATYMQFANPVAGTKCSALPLTAFSAKLPYAVVKAWTLKDATGLRQVCALFSNIAGSTRCGAYITSAAPTITPPPPTNTPPVTTVTPPTNTPIPPTLTATPTPPLACTGIKIQKAGVDVTPADIHIGDMVDYIASVNNNGQQNIMVTFEMTLNGDPTTKKDVPVLAQLDPIDNLWYAKYSYQMNEYGKHSVTVISVTGQ